MRVAACGFCHHDLLVMAGALRRGVRPGVILGHEIAGVVVEVGGEVASLHAGDRVTITIESIGTLTNTVGGFGAAES